MRSKVATILLGVLAIFSLGSVSVSVCSCAHHHEVKTEVPSCPGHSNMPGMDAGSDSTTAETSSCAATDAGCVCAENAPQTFAKSYAPELQQFVALLTSKAEQAAFPTPLRPGSPRVVFERPFDLTDSFYNLSPKRGPPVL